MSQTTFNLGMFQTPNQIVLCDLSISGVSHSRQLAKALQIYGVRESPGNPGGRIVQRVASVVARPKNTGAAIGIVSAVSIGKTAAREFQATAR
jgi:hypothetical protein